MQVKLCMLEHNLQAGCFLDHIYPPYEERATSNDPLDWIVASRHQVFLDVYQLPCSWCFSEPRCLLLSDSSLMLKFSVLYYLNKLFDKKKR